MSEEFLKGLALGFLIVGILLIGIGVTRICVPTYEGRLIAFGSGLIVGYFTLKLKKRL